MGTNSDFRRATKRNSKMQRTAPAKGTASATGAVPSRYVINVCFLLLLTLNSSRAEHALEAGGVAVAPPQRVRSATATFLPPAPIQSGSTRRRRAHQPPPSSESEESGDEAKGSEDEGSEDKGSEDEGTEYKVSEDENSDDNGTNDEGTDNDDAAEGNDDNEGK